MTRPTATTDLLRCLLRAVDHKAATLSADAHPAWIEATWARLGPHAHGYATRLPPPRHSALLANIYGLAWPALDAFRAPAHRMALLDRTCLLRVLAACGLEGRRDQVRRSVGRIVRRLLIEGVGESAYEKVLDSPMRGIQASRPLNAPEVEQERLAEEGFRALCAQSAWRDASLITVVRLSLAPSALVGPCPIVDRPPSSPLNVADRIVDRLHDYFPELAWLFGSDMDGALSALRTDSSELATSPH
jgi:hypothetical protein